RHLALLFRRLGSTAALVLAFQPMTRLQEAGPRTFHSPARGAPRAGSTSMPGLPLDHVGIAVRSIAEALPLFQLITGGDGSPTEQVADQGVAVAFVGSGPARLELIEPITPDSPVARFLERRGPGLHHLAYAVPDIAAALDRLRRAGIRLVDQEPRLGAHGRRVAFLHPASTGGVLIELVEAPADTETAPTTASP